MSKIDCALPSNYPWDVVKTELAELSKGVEEVSQIVSEQHSLLMSHQKTLIDLQARISSVESSMKKVNKNG